MHKDSHKTLERATRLKDEEKEFQTPAV